jgi:DivIVA domain-containing protein
MALMTADDVLNRKFQATKFREGYDQDEVDDFLDEVVNTLRGMTAENDDLKAKLANAERRIAELSRAGASAAAVAPIAPKIEAPAPLPLPPPPVEVALPVPMMPEPTPAPMVAPMVPAAQQRMSEPESATGMLALAQKLHDDYVRSGQEEGDRIIADSKSQGARIVQEAEDTSSRTLAQLEQERSLLERKIDELRVFERDYRTRLKSYLENLLGDLDARGGTASAKTTDAGGASVQPPHFGG